jgi:transketolase
VSSIPKSNLDSNKIAKDCRKKILVISNKSKVSHVGSSLSVVDILSVLYSGIANISKDTVQSSNRDIIILSKGHAALALYSVLTITGFLSEQLLAEFSSNGAVLGGHTTSFTNSGVELSTGSLGHGLPYGLGIALSRKNYNLGGRVFVIISDGECNEGTTWESALLANQHGLENLTVIIDRNRIQSLDFTENTLKLEPLEDKWKSFGWDTVRISGHDHESLRKVLKFNSEQRKPLCVIADTIKGKGVSFMENTIMWHYKYPNDEQLSMALTELDLN